MLFFYKEPVYKEPTCRRPKYLKNYTTKNDTPKELFDLKDFYKYKHQELKKNIPFKCFIE